MENTKSKLAKFRDKCWRFTGYCWITAIFINISLNVYGHFKGYEKSGRSIIIPDSDFFIIFHKFSILLMYLGLFSFILSICLAGFLKIKNFYIKNQISKVSIK